MFIVSVVVGRKKGSENDGGLYPSLRWECIIAEKILCLSLP